LTRNTPILLVAILGLAACDDFEAPCEPGRLTIVGRVQGEDLDLSYEISFFGIRTNPHLDDRLFFGAGSDTVPRTIIFGELEAMPRESDAVAMRGVIFGVQDHLLTSSDFDSTVEDDGQFYRLVLRELVEPVIPGLSEPTRLGVEPRFISGDEVHVCVGARNAE
jgi:hypothetical protein